MNDIGTKSNKLKHSKIGLAGFYIFLSTLIPLLYALTGLARIKLPVLSLSPYQIEIASKLLSFWCIGGTVLAFILSYMDLETPKKAKILTKITLAITGSIIVLGFISSLVPDILRFFNTRR